MFESHQIIDEDGKATEEKIESHEIKKIISQKVVDQTAVYTWLDEEVELKDGRQVKTRVMKRNGKYQ